MSTKHRRVLLIDFECTPGTDQQWSFTVGSFTYRGKEFWRTLCWLIMLDGDGEESSDRHWTD